MYRGVTLSSCVSKLFERVLVEILGEALESDCHSLGEERHPRQQSTEKLPPGYKSTVPIQVIGESRSEPIVDCSTISCSYITTNDAMPKFQSVSRQFHSNETALIKIFNDFLLAADQGQVSPLRMLDLTSAFDTVDHALLQTRLQRSFGVEGGVEDLTLHALAHCLVYISKPDNMQSAVASVQQCVTAIEQWVAASRLRFNMDKTKLL